MVLRVTRPNVKICAMCQHWNGPLGGNNVKPRKGMRGVFEFDSEERNTCYKNHFEKSAWNSCKDWAKRY